MSCVRIELLNTHIIYQILKWRLFCTSHTRSRVAIHDAARWQFCNTTHVPSFCAVSIIRRAIGPWPCPSDNELSLAPPNPYDFIHNNILQALFITWSSENFSNEAIGSAPGDNTKMSGAQLCESANALPRSKGGGSINWWPSLAVTKSCIAGTIYMGKIQLIFKEIMWWQTLSGLKQRRISNCWKCSRWPQSLGIGSLCGSYSIACITCSPCTVTLMTTYHTIINFLPIIKLCCKLYSQMLEPTVTHYTHC